jgi:hypothetical protein
MIRQAHHRPLAKILQGSAKVVDFFLINYQKPIIAFFKFLGFKASILFIGLLTIQLELLGDGLGKQNGFYPLPLL